MKREMWRAISVVASSLLILSLMVSVDPLAQAQNQATAKAEPQWLLIQSVRVKPDMLTEWQDMQKSETIPALQKGGVKWRGAWETAIFGESFEYVFVTPIESFAQFDGDSPIRKALGPEAARTYGTKARRLIAGAHSYAVQLRPDLSIQGEMAGPPKLAVVNFISVAPGRNTEFESMIKNEVLPVIKQAGISNYWVHRTMLGGNANEYITVTVVDNFADIGKGHPFVRVLGQEGANKLFQKGAGIITHTERIVARYNPDLSFSPPAQAPAK